MKLFLVFGLSMLLSISVMAEELSFQIETMMIAGTNIPEKVKIIVPLEVASELASGIKMVGTKSKELKIDDNGFRVIYSSEKPEIDPASIIFFFSKESGSLTKIEFKDHAGLSSGITVFLETNGRMYCSSHWKGGVKIGREVQVRADGVTVFSESNYIEGKQEGDYREYSKDGSLVVFGQYRNGKKDGKWTMRKDGKEEIIEYPNFPEIHLGP